MNNLPVAQLQQKIANARQQIPVGSKWQHYKGDVYVVTDLVVIELTGEVAAVFRFRMLGAG